MDGASSTSSSLVGKGSSSFTTRFTNVDISWVFLDGLLILFCLWILVPRSFFDDDEKETSAPPAVVLPAPIAVDIPESKHVNMEVSVDDKTWVEEGEEDEE